MAQAEVPAAPAVEEAAVQLQPTARPESVVVAEPIGSNKKKRVVIRPRPSGSPSAPCRQRSASYPMANTPEEHKPGADIGGGSQEDLLDICQREPGLLLLLAESLGNPLELLFLKAHVSKAFCEATGAALKDLKSVELSQWRETVDDAVVIAVASKCTNLTALSLKGCRSITDAAVQAVAKGCKQLVSLDLTECETSDAAVEAVTKGCKQLTSLNLRCCDITDVAVLAVAEGCKQLTSLDLSACNNFTDAAVEAVAEECKQLTSLSLSGCYNLTDAAVVAVAEGCTNLTSLNVCGCYHITDDAVLTVAKGCKQLTSLNLRGCQNITDVAVEAVTEGCKRLTLHMYSTT